MKHAIPNNHVLTASRFRLKRGRVAGLELRKTRVFDLQIDLAPFHTQQVLTVLSSLETVRLQVFDENDSTALEDIDSAETTDLSVKTTKIISIRRWLAAGCQVVRWDVGGDFDQSERKRGVMACYRNNAPQVLFPIGTNHVPPGPSAFVGEIIVNADEFRSKDDESTANRLCCVLAHEFTHVFDFLRWLVPALKNWRCFWRKFLNEGQGCDMAAQFAKFQVAFVDDYGSENELEILKLYWPSHADEWFKALRKGHGKSDSTLQAGHPGTGNSD